MNSGHRINFSKQSQKNMEDQNNAVMEFTNVPKLDNFMLAVRNLYYAPMVVYLTLNKGYIPYSVYDLGGFGMSLMLAAKDFGVDSLVAYSLVTYPEVLRKYLKFPDDEDIIVGIALGYEEEDKTINKFRSTRLPLEKFCHFRNKLEKI